MPHLVRSRWIARHARHIRREGAVVVLNDGSIGAVLDEDCKASDWRRVEGLRSVDLGDAVLLPGLVNAHAHLELSELEVPPAADFGTWVAGVLAARAGQTSEDYRRAVEVGARRLLATGTTCVGDFDSSGASEASLPACGIRSRVYRELLDGDNPARTRGQVERLLAPFEGGPRSSPGIAPHAPHTVSDSLLEHCASHARGAAQATSVHWAETEAECEWLSRGSGVFAKFLSNSPLCSGLQHLERGGLLGPSLSLVHGNFPEPGDLQRVAAAGATLVHCPGTHAYFERPRVDLEAWHAAGISVALGTDSLASNKDLDMRREMSLVRREHPGLEAAVVLDWATCGGARALQFQDRIGELAVGKFADMLALDATGMESAADVVEGVTGACPDVCAVWVQGRQV